jgi:hypothetical protein
MRCEDDARSLARLHAVVITSSLLLTPRSAHCLPPRVRSAPAVARCGEASHRMRTCDASSARDAESVRKGGYGGYGGYGGLASHWRDISADSRGAARSTRCAEQWRNPNPDGFVCRRLPDTVAIAAAPCGTTPAPNNDAHTVPGNAAAVTEAPWPPLPQSPPPPTPPPPPSPPPPAAPPPAPPPDAHLQFARALLTDGHIGLLPRGHTVKSIPSPLRPRAAQAIDALLRKLAADPTETALHVALAMFPRWVLRRDPRRSSSTRRGVRRRFNIPSQQRSQSSTMRMRIDRWVNGNTSTKISLMRSLRRADARAHAAHACATKKDAPKLSLPTLCRAECSACARLHHS